MDINENCINILKETAKKLIQSKQRWKQIRETDMHMVVLDQLVSDSVNQLIIDSEVVNLYNAIKKTTFVAANDSKRVNTRGSNKAAQQSSTKYHFIQKMIICPLFPQVDY